jgi:hypothetical protein
MKFSIFHKNKKTEQNEETAASPPQETAQTETTATPEEPKTETLDMQAVETEGVTKEPETVISGSSMVETYSEVAAPIVGVNEPLNKTYLKAMPLKDLTDLEKIKSEILNGNIVILKLTPLAKKSLDDVKMAVNELDKFSGSVGGDIGRLGEERVVICPKSVRIWREKTPVQCEPSHGAAATVA